MLTDVRSTDGKEEASFDRSLPFMVKRVQRHKLLLRTYLKRVALARKLIRTHDRVLFSGKFPLFLLHWLYRKSEKKKWVAIVHGSELLLTKARQAAWVRQALQKATMVVAVSNYTASLIPYISKEEISVIPNGHGIAPTTLKAGNKITFAPLRLITIGNLTERKGQHNVVKALPKLVERFPNLEYHLVGIPTEKEVLIKLAKELGVEQRLIFHGRVDEEEKIKLLGQADVFMMLSQPTAQGDVEGFGIAILEANALGIPAIGAVGTGIEDAIKPGYSGELVAVNDTEAIVSALEKIRRDYASYVTQAQQWADEFQWEKIVGRYLELLEA